MYISFSISFPGRLSSGINITNKKTLKKKQSTAALQLINS
jgi:hypothetical protein